jgi:hypothetical protein
MSFKLNDNMYTVDFNKQMINLLSGFKIQHILL